MSTLLLVRIARSDEMTKLITMQSTRAFKIWLVSLFLTAAIVLISVQWLDKPIALEVRAIFGQRSLPVELIESPLTSTSLAAALAFLVFGILATMGRNFSKFETTIALCVISTLAALVIKDQLKVVFGRTWPDTWAPGIVSFSGQRRLWIPFFPSRKIVRVFSVRACDGCRSRLIRPMDFVSKASGVLFFGHVGRGCRPCGSQPPFSWRYDCRHFCWIFDGVVYDRVVSGNRIRRNSWAYDPAYMNLNANGVVPTLVQG